MIFSDSLNTMGNIKSASYCSTINAIKELSVIDFNDKKIFDDAGCMLYPVMQMSLFWVERCLRDDIDNNFVLHSQFDKFFINVITRNNYIFIQVTLRPTYDNLNNWLVHNMKTQKAMNIIIDDVKYGYFKMAEKSMIQICEINNWEFTARKKIECAGITMFVNISI